MNDNSRGQFKDMRIIKIGGSIITDKNRFQACDIANIRKIGSALSKVKKPFIIVHGTGGFGKIPALKYRYVDGEVRPGLVPCARIKAGVLKLHSVLISEFSRKGLDVVGFRADSMAEVSGSLIKKMRKDFLIKWLRMGFIPVVCGDMVCDEKKGLSICSSDRVAAHLAALFKAKELIFLTDVDGIFDEKGRVFAEISKKELGKFVQRLPKSPMDVSGGMRGKIEALLPYIHCSFVVRIINGLKKESLESLFKGVSRGTLIRGKRIRDEG